MVEAPSPSTRINKWRKEFLAIKPEICPDHALMRTESMKETEGKPQIIKNGKALTNVLRKMSIFIGKQELIVWNQSN